jgi:hypothetical protein
MERNKSASIFLLHGNIYAFAKAATNAIRAEKI